MLGDVVLLEVEIEFKGFGRLALGQRLASFPGQESVMESVDQAKPAIPGPRAVLDLIADRQDRWTVFCWAHYVRRNGPGSIPISDPVAQLVQEGLDVYGLIDDKKCPYLVYQNVLPIVAERIFETSIKQEDELGLRIHQWNGLKIPSDLVSSDAGNPQLSPVKLRELIKEVVTIFNEEELRASPKR